ncbi:hypothetical protein BDV12DRAFT_192149 [Aspergillus spectabilis]
MRRECIAAARSLSFITAVLCDGGRFFYWHHCCWHLFELGVVFAEGINAGLDLIWQGQDTFLQPNDAAKITGAMQSFPVVLRLMNHRWPQIKGVAVEFDQIFDPVLNRLDKWIAGGNTSPLLQAQSFGTKSYLFKKNWKQLDAFFEHSVQTPVFSRLSNASGTMTMEEVFRVLQPAEPLPDSTHLLIMVTDVVMPEFSTLMQCLIQVGSRRWVVRYIGLVVVSSWMIYLRRSNAGGSY